MCDCNSMKDTWEKILEYASSPVHGTMSRKLRKGVSLKINGDMIIKDAQIFMSDTFVRLTTSEASGESVNTYYDIGKIVSIQTVSSIESKQ